MTQVGLAKAARLSQSRLSMAEAGLLELRPDEIRALREALVPELSETLRAVREFQGGKLEAAEVTT
jgi:hypothetical protein